MDFDMFTGLVCVLIALSSGFVIYGISKFTMKGYSSYDDVIASRRQEKSRPASSDRSSEAKKLKKIKKKLKKENLWALSVGSVNSAEDTAPEEEAVTPPQEEIQEIPAVVLIPQKVEEKPAPVTKVKNKVKAAKKVEEPEITETVVKKLTEVVYETKVEKESSPKNEPKFIPEPLHFENDIANNSVDEEGSTPNDLAGKMKKKIKKKKTENSVEDSGKLTLQTLLPLLKQAEFSHGEVQILIDALLNKDESEWLKGKQDPMLKLKKQVIEMVKLHADDTETINGLQVKLASLRSELNSEKSNNKTFREALTKASGDVQAISIKFQQLSEEKESLHMNIQQLKQQLNEEHIIVLKLQEEKLLFSQMNVSHEQHHEAVVALQSQVNQIAAQLSDQQTLNANLAAQLDETMRFEEDYRQVNALNVELDHLLSNSQFEVNRLNTDLVSLSKQLEDSRKQVGDLSNMIEAIKVQKNELLSENEHLKVEIAKANQDMRTYQKMADTLEEKNKNGSINFHNDHSECQTLLDEKDQVIKNLNVELSQKENAIEKMTNDIINCKNEANKKQTIIENLNVELSSLKNLGVKTSTDLNEEKSAATSFRASLAEKTETITKLTKEVESYKYRNNELRSKNWKVVEALQKAEASLKDLSMRHSNSIVVDDASVTTIKCRINRLMEPLISSSSLDNISNIEDNNLWLDKLEEIISCVNIEQNSEKMLAQITKLQNLVTHYRSVITDLERMLLDLEIRIESANKNEKSATHTEVDVDE